MLLPTKGVSPDRALLTLGGDVLALLKEPKTVSKLWSDVQRDRLNRSALAKVSFDWFILSLDVLFALGCIQLNKGKLVCCAERGSGHDSQAL